MDNRRITQKKMTEYDRIMDSLIKRYSWRRDKWQPISNFPTECGYYCMFLRDDGWVDAADRTIDRWNIYVLTEPLERCIASVMDSCIDEYVRNRNYVSYARNYKEPLPRRIVEPVSLIDHSDIDTEYNPTKDACYEYEDDYGENYQWAKSVVWAMQFKLLAERLPSL